MNDTGIAAVKGRERSAQSVDIGRHQNEMHMIRHQASGPHGDIGRTAVLRKQIAIERVIVIAEEGARAAVPAPLGPTHPRC